MSFLNNIKHFFSSSYPIQQTSTLPQEDRADYLLDQDFVNERITSDMICCYPGIINHGGNDCWANSLLQTFASNPIIKGELLKISHLLRLSGDDEGADAARSLYEATNHLEQERQEGRPLSSIDSMRIRELCHAVLRPTSVTAQNIVSLSRSDQIDPLEVYGALVTKHTELYEKNRQVELAPILMSSCKKETILQLDSAAGILKKSIRNDPIAGFKVEALPFKDELMALFHKKDEIYGLRISEEDTQDLLRPYQDGVFQQMIQNYFVTPEHLDSEHRDVEDPVSGRTLRGKLLETRITLDKPPAAMVINLEKNEWVEGRQGKLSCRVTADFGYGICTRNIPLDVPMLEKFTLSAKIAGEEKSYELANIIFHVGIGASGHYVSFQKISGVWYRFDDYEASIATDQQLQEALNGGYGYFYSATSEVDPTAMLIDDRGDANQIRAHREHLLDSLSAPIGQQRGQASFHGIRGTSHRIAAQKVVNDPSELDGLLQIKEFLLHISNRDQFFDYFSTISPELQSHIVDELKSRATSDPKVLEMMAKNYSHEGGAILEKNINILSQVFRENDGGFGALDFNNDTSLLTHYNLLVANLYQEPVDFSCVKRLLEEKNFAHVQDQIKEAVYASAINDRIARLTQERLFEECLSIVEHFIDIKQKDVAQGIPSATPSFVNDLNDVHTRLCKMLLEKQGRYKGELKDPINGGRKLLDHDLSNMKLLLRAQSSVPRVLNIPFSIQVSNKERGDFDDLMALLKSEEKGEALKKKLNKKLYESNISTATRNEIRRFVCLTQVAEELESDAIKMLYSPKELTAEERKMLIDVPSSEDGKRHANERLSQKIDPTMQEMQIQRSVESNKPFTSGQNNDSPLKKFQQSLENNLFAFGGSYGQLRSQLSNIRFRFKEAQKPMTLEEELKELADALKRGGVAFGDILDAKSASVREGVHLRLCKVLLEKQGRYKGKLKDPINGGRTLLDDDLSNMKLLLRAQSSVPRFLNIPFSIQVSKKERGDFDDLMALLESEEKGEALKKKLYKKLYESNISTATRNEIRTFVCLTQVTEELESDAINILYSPKELEPEERKMLIDALLPS